MAAAEVVPTAELREPFAHIYRSFRAQRFSELRTPELRQLEDRWQAAGAPLSRLAGLVTDPQVSLPQLQGAIMEFEEALDAFCRDASALVRAVARKNKDFITAAAEKDRHPAAKGRGEEASSNVSDAPAGIWPSSERPWTSSPRQRFEELELRAGRLPSSHAGLERRDATPDACRDSEPLSAERIAGPVSRRDQRFQESLELRGRQSACDVEVGPVAGPRIALGPGPARLRLVRDRGPAGG